MRQKSIRRSSQSVRGISTWLTSIALIGALQSPLLSAGETVDRAWRDFLHALDEPAMIGANADHPLANSVWRPIPALDPQDIQVERFRLGFDLFHEGRLSSRNSIACITCHAGAIGGADRRQVSIGVDGARGTMNSLSVFNAAFNFRQFWDGRAVTLEDQALIPIQAEVEMANTLDAVLQMLQNDSLYPAKFAAVYPDGVTINNMADAIAYFQHINFIRRDTPFQRQLNGADGELSDQALRGWQRFEQIGCATCHNGINLGGNSYQQLGAALPYYGGHRPAGPHDVGVMGRSGRDQDRHLFKVPGLHGVATTPPYLHDGSVATLNEAIEKMGEHQLGRELSQQDVEDIAAFLHATSGTSTGSNTVRAAITEPSADSERATDETQLLTHHQAYLRAIDITETGGARLLSEMYRINSREVAHYDFLQFQHRELIRHARALHYPPSTLDASIRDQLASVAQELLAAVNQLEWLIADFLRAEAMTRVFTTHQTIPADGALVDQLGDITVRLSEQQAVSRQAMQNLSSLDPGHLATAIRALYQDNQ
jgi:cytochrome c peroxidase